MYIRKNINPSTLDVWRQAIKKTPLLQRFEESACKRCSCETLLYVESRDMVAEVLYNRRYSEMEVYSMIEQMMKP